MINQCNNLTTLLSKPFIGIYLWIKPYVNNLSFINNCSQTLYFIGLIGIAGAGIFVVVPALYNADGSEGLCFTVQCVVAFLALQLQLNWTCMKIVSSAYIPSIHGTKPDDIAIGQMINDTRKKQNGSASQNNGHSDTTGSSTKAIRRNNPSIMYVASEMPIDEFSPPKRQPYAYLSWTPCLQCRRPRPPRCHHCPVCQVCVLKRDHHCFFTGVCIGVNNLRHFAVFLFWAVAAIAFATIHAVPYALNETWPQIRIWDVLFPIAIIRAMFGYLEASAALFVFLYWVLGFFMITAGSFFFECYQWIASGTTSFEISNKMIVHDTRSFQDKLRAVFGDYWMLNFIFPVHFVFKPVEDPVAWPFIQG